MSKHASFPSDDEGLKRYIQTANRTPMMSLEEEIAAATRWRDFRDQAAADRMVEAHLRFVVRIAAGYRGYGFPINELVAEGNVGLIKALNRFDPEKGFRFSTYSMWWIKASIQEYILKNWSFVRLGTTASQKMLFFNLRKTKGRMGITAGGEMNHEDVAEISKRLGVPEKDVVDMNRRLLGDASLNAQVPGTEDPVEWIDMLQDDSESPEETVVRQQTQRIRQNLLRKALTILTRREMTIVQSRKLSDDPRTLEDLAQEFSISRERVRQIETRALEKISKHVLKASEMAEQPLAEILEHVASRVLDEMRRGEESVLQEEAAGVRQPRRRAEMRAGSPI